MQRIFDRVAWFVVGTITISLLLVISDFHSPALSQVQLAFPTAINSCIPAGQVVRSELVAKTQFRGTDYYLLAAYEQDDDWGNDLVIAVSNQGCQELLYNPTGDRLALFKIVPRSVARQLTLQRYQQTIDRLGQPIVQQQVEAAVKGNTLWYDEELWALRQLGFTVLATGPIE